MRTCLAYYSLGLVLVIFLFSGKVYAAEVIFSEIAWMGTLPKEGESAQAAANNEWIELFNSGVSTVSLEGWKLIAQDGAPDILLAASIPAGGYFLLERGSDDVVPGIGADLIYPFKNNALSNSGEEILLKDASGNQVDTVDASSGWPAGDNTTKYTMQRQGAAWVSAEATPRSGLEGSSSALQGSPVVPPSGAGSGASSPSLPTIKVRAGEDLTAVAGGEVEFFGEAYDVHDEPFEKARFWWNFGDGGTGEGRIVSHIFQIPGKYTVGLHVSSASLAASDYLEVNVVPNQISITDVIAGKEGFVKFRNPVGVLLDIGGWVIKDSQRISFMIPSKTKIGARSDIAFPNSSTGLLQDGAPPKVTVFYSNLVEAFSWSGDVASKSVLTPSVQEVTLPAVENSQEKPEVAKFKGTQTDLAQVSAGGASAGGKLIFGAAAILSIIAAAGFLFFKGRFR